MDTSTRDVARNARGVTSAARQMLAPQTTQLVHLKALLWTPPAECPFRD